MIADVLKHALMITGFVSVMMLVIEYLNVVTQGAWQETLARRRWTQYILAAFLGATPGCLGAFAVAAMYAHRRISIGALTAAMIATSGDEAFVMLAMAPGTALGLTVILFALGIAVGIAADFALAKHVTRRLSCEDDFSIHKAESCQCFDLPGIARQWRNCSAARGLLSGGLLLFMAAIAGGRIGPEEWNWIRVTLFSVSGLALFIAATVPDHFLDAHLWRHVVRGHAPRIFLWTFGALLAIHLLEDHLGLAETIQRNKWVVLLLACVVGLVPDSGPHLIFFTMFLKGLAPFSVLMASSIVQDGHGMLPVLAHSRRAFIAVKLVNFAAGLLAGGLLMLLGY